jgi:ABC-2 type transport system ATP-binding protein
LIEVKNLTKKYGGHMAVSNLSFKIESGHIYGLLGPNGAGKSTTMNIMTGCLAATSGEVLIGGYDIFEEAEKAKRLIGYLPEFPPLYQDMTPKEYLSFVAKAKGVSKSERDKQIDGAMNVTKIKSVQDRLIKNLSKGFKQRVGIAQALLGSPEVIILDEPTVGLDPKQIIEIRDLIKELGLKHTVILSSHILSEVSAVCDYVMIISKGKLVASDTPQNLEKLFTGDTIIELKVKAAEGEVKKALASIAGITRITYTSSKEDKTATVSVYYEGKDDISERIFMAFSDMRRPILKMDTKKASLEEVFLKLTSEKEAASAQLDNQETEPEDEQHENNLDYGEETDTVGENNGSEDTVDAGEPDSGEEEEKKE